MTQQKKKKKPTPTEAKAAELRQLAADIVGQPEPDDDQDDTAETEARRAVVLAFSEQAQAALAADLAARALELLSQKAGPDAAAEHYAEKAIILRALAAHAQAETLAELASGPDLAELMAAGEMPEGPGAYDDETMPHEWDEEGGGDAY
jgi:hypothetical protein